MPPSIESPPEETKRPVSYSENDFPMAPIPPKKSKKGLVMKLVIGLVAIGIGFAIWQFIPSKNATTDTAAKTTNDATDQKNSQQATSDIPEAKNYKEYSNGFLGLKLEHPDAWTVTEAENGVRIESPDFAYQTTNKGTVTGNFRIYIRKGARSIDGKYIGRGYAIQPSEKLIYASPAPGQRADTNLTLFGLDEPKDFGFFMIAGNYSLQKGDTLGPNYGKELETYIVAGGFSEKSLTDDLATNSVSQSMLTKSQAYDQAIAIIKSLNLR